jgi:cobalt/nickel transport system ATP-binding protein
MLDVKNLSVRYNADDPSPALYDVSFSVQEGEKIALTGNNGAGKSTLLLTLMGILIPENGKIIFEGMECTPKTAPLFRRRIGFVMQNPDDQLFMPAVYDDIAFGLREARNFPEAEIEKKIAATMKALRIEELKGKLCHRLSGGEKRLVALAGVLVMEPAMLLLDEPATFLDPPARQRLIEILSGLPQTMIIATHDLDMAAQLCGRELRLERGSFPQNGAIIDSR